MKFTSTFVALALIAAMPTVQVHAQTASVESALNQFDATVASDRVEATKTLVDQLTALEKNSSKDEVLAQLKASALTAQGAKDVEALAKFAKKHNLSNEEIAKRVKALNIEKTTANWSNGATGVVVGILLIAIIIAAINADSFGVSVGYYDDYYYDCYYDWYGNYVCY